MRSLVKPLPSKPYRSSYDGIGEDGPTILQTPWPLSRDDLEHLEDWIAICMKTIRRVSEKSWKEGIHPLAAVYFVGCDVELIAHSKEPQRGHPDT